MSSGPRAVKTSPPREESQMSDALGDILWCPRCGTQLETWAIRLLPKGVDLVLYCETASHWWTYNGPTVQHPTEKLIRLVAREP